MTARIDRPASREPSTSLRPWQVVHACQYVRDITDVLEAQTSVGMRPHLITGGNCGRNDGPTARAASLMQGWSEVRSWRKRLEESSAHTNAQLLHAHSFAAGMAGIRSGAVVVYDLRQFIDGDPSESGLTTSWLGRSFRTAEQFVMTRAGAVVVHLPSMKQKCLDRGVSSDDVFIVPDALSEEVLEMTSKNLHPSSIHIDPKSIHIFARISSRTDQWTMTAEILLPAFAQLQCEVPAIQFLLANATGMESEVLALATAHGISESLRFVSPSEEISAIQASQVLIAGIHDSHPEDSRPASCPSSLVAMACGRALLAADVPANRDLSPEGRGVVWFSPEPAQAARDLAQRLAFMARNPDFCRALGKAAQSFILETRSLQRIGRLYDAVYQHAFKKRRTGGPSQDNSGTLIPINAAC